jgi:DNA-binding protein HU-beta
MPAKEAAPAKSATQATLKHLAAALADSHEIAKKQAEAVLGDLVTLTTRHLKKGDKIRLTGLGIFQVRKRAARMGRNPATGEAIKIKASKKIAFRPARRLTRSNRIAGDANSASKWLPLMRDGRVCAGYALTSQQAAARAARAGVDVLTDIRRDSSTEDNAE